MHRLSIITHHVPKVKNWLLVFQNGLGKTSHVFKEYPSFYVRSYQTNPITVKIVSLIFPSLPRDITAGLNDKLKIIVFFIHAQNWDDK
jgi:hypothetical protein